MIALFGRRPALRRLSAAIALVGFVNGTLAPLALAQARDEPRDNARNDERDAPHNAAGKDAEATRQKSFSRRDIERLVAPIALYPDTLLTHVLMAATYPLEVVQAARWREAHPDLSARDLEEALRNEPWDDSVKAITAFPQVLQMMNEKLDWTQELGEAFLAQDEDVFAVVQELRQRAETAGNLQSSSKRLKVSRLTDGDGPAYWAIDPVDPDEIYVPVYDPTVVYGTWPYPDDPPYYWYPRGWHRDQLFWFGSAVLIGTALWAGWNWRRRQIVVNPQRYNAFNRSSVQHPAWSFKPNHRKGVQFKSPVLTKKFGPVAGPTAAQRALLKQNAMKSATMRSLGTLPKGAGPATAKVLAPTTSPTLSHPPKGPGTSTGKPSGTGEHHVGTHSKHHAHPVPHKAVTPPPKSAHKTAPRPVPKTVVKAAPKPAHKIAPKPAPKAATKAAPKKKNPG